MQTPKLIHLSLGVVGLHHIKNRFGVSEYTSNKPLRRALANLNLDWGDAWTWATPGATFTSEDLHGGLPAGITQEIHRGLLTDFIVDYLVKDGRLAIEEDHDASPSDPWLTEQAGLPPRLACGKHLYWYAARPDRSVVEGVTRWGFGLFKCMALTTPDIPWPPDAALTEGDIGTLARAADHFVVDAYDFEGFVIWSRSGQACRGSLLEVDLRATLSVLPVDVYGRSKGR